MCSLKQLAKATGLKKVEMMKPAEAEKLTGYKVGGISPFGQMKAVPTVFEAAAMAHALVYLNGGQRGLQVRLAPADAVSAAEAIYVASGSPMRISANVNRPNANNIWLSIDSSTFSQDTKNCVSIGLSSAKSRFPVRINSLK